MYSVPYCRQAASRNTVPSWSEKGAPSSVNGRVGIVNIGTLVPGRLGEPVVRDTSLTIEDGVITAIGESPDSVHVLVDAAGLTVTPGFVDGHVHPVAGEWTPAQDATGWIRRYLHGGTTSMVSAGELHFPGLPLQELRPDVVTALACVSRVTSEHARPSGVKATFGTLLLVPGMSEADFDRASEAGVRLVKFIFYPWSHLGDGEAKQYVEWAHERGMLVKVHSGGVSRSGVSQVTGYSVLEAVRPDIVAHLSGGPIPMSPREMSAVVKELPDIGVEICSSMNFRATIDLVGELVEFGGLDRLTLGTDTPGGTGVIPRGMLRNILLLAAVCGMPAADAVAVATSNTARWHGLDVGEIQLGRPADLVIMGPVEGSTASDALEAVSIGDLPGIAVVMVDGQVLIGGRSEQTPPPRHSVTIDVR